MKRLEDDLQRAQIGYLERLRAQGRLEYFAVPNGGLRSRKEAAIMKGLGVRAGVPDLVILWSVPFMGGQGTPLPLVGFIENKAPEGRASQPQKDWALWLGSHGHRHAEVRSFDAFLAVLHGWGLISDRELVGGGA